LPIFRMVLEQLERFSVLSFACYQHFRFHQVVVAVASISCFEAPVVSVIFTPCSAHTLGHIAAVRRSIRDPIHLPSAALPFSDAQGGLGARHQVRAQRGIGILLGGRLESMCNERFHNGLYRVLGLGNFVCDVWPSFGHGQGQGRLCAKRKEIKGALDSRSIAPKSPHGTICCEHFPGNSNYDANSQAKRPVNLGFLLEGQRDIFGASFVMYVDG
jgi:hypothetical protein